MRRTPAGLPPPNGDYSDPGFKKNVADWIRGLRHGDGREQHEQAFRDSRKGDLATGGVRGQGRFLPDFPGPADDGHFPEDKS